jgi:hypothetical protein
MGAIMFRISLGGKKGRAEPGREQLATTAASTTSRTPCACAGLFIPFPDVLHFFTARLSRRQSGRPA